MVSQPKVIMVLCELQIKVMDVVFVAAERSDEMMTVYVMDVDIDMRWLYY